MGPFLLNKNEDQKSWLTKFDPLHLQKHTWLTKWGSYHFKNIDTKNDG